MTLTLVQALTTLSATIFTPSQKMDYQKVGKDTQYLLILHMVEGIEAWIKKAYEESQDSNTKVVMLIPARTDTRYWHDYVMKAELVYFVKGRLKFGDSSNSAPFPSAVVVFNNLPEGWADDYPRMGALQR